MDLGMRDSHEAWPGLAEGQREHLYQNVHAGVPDGTG